MIVPPTTDAVALRNHLSGVIWVYDRRARALVDLSRPGGAVGFSLPWLAAARWDVSHARFVAFLPDTESRLVSAG